MYLHQGSVDLMEAAAYWDVENRVSASSQPLIKFSFYWFERGSHEAFWPGVSSLVVSCASAAIASLLLISSLHCTGGQGLLSTPRKVL
ncbi:hypothetical protein H6P81_017276 [Aristolochia fimbriata]|uniref:Uncharacterized protein n=1 Tax=Aristolochia fimbriata TaxID=158543 RepID=A0AAV7E0P8_ARIFI|nr:hypothetical protein H6P81_017276 [Aristolochia fimbriata]